MVHGSDRPLPSTTVPKLSTCRLVTREESPGLATFHWEWQQGGTWYYTPVGSGYFHLRDELAELARRAHGQSQTDASGSQPKSSSPAGDHPGRTSPM